MSVIAEFTIPTEEFALSATFDAIPNLAVEIERMVAHPASRVLPYIWVCGGAAAAVEKELRADPTTVSVTKLTEIPYGSLYRIEWADETKSTVEDVLESDPVILTGTAAKQGWDFQMRFEHRDHISKLQADLTHHDVTIELKRLHTPETPTVDGQFLLTAKQRASLNAALDAGYFEVPRKTNLSELAEQLDISQQALSKRLRRAHRTVSRHILTTGPDEIVGDNRLD
ncbi:helix-turn-helix domain-containing protein [Haladaptatus sp. CMAA 1911]|uniref:helix-turn-helix domain-containing protein n=1 Tax=unclassified Haladaptatus TaxID=2622732 RepID=UPI0037543C3F